MQVLGDNYGSVVHLGERECSLQRRHQKLIEECPSPAVDAELRTNIGAAAVQGVQAVKYRSAGTMEFLLDDEGNFYFIEMNTRIQVEHPITEMVYGVDLIKEQIRLASGEELGLSQTELIPRGHAVECRINTEDIRANFRPCPGTVGELYVPGGLGVRWDSHVYQGYAIPPYYDSMLGKLIAWGKDRDEAVRRMIRALDELVVMGVETTIPFHQAVLRDPRFRAGDYSTHFVDRWLKETKL